MNYFSPPLFFYRGDKDNPLDQCMYRVESKKRRQCRYHARMCSWNLVCLGKHSRILHLHRHSKGYYIHQTRNQAKSSSLNFFTYSRLSVFGLQRIFKVGYVETPTTPLISLIQFVFLCWVNKGFHSMRIRALIFLQIH